VIGLRQDRSEATAGALLTEDLTGRQRGAITAVCTDMHRPYLNAVATVLPKAEVVFDKFLCRSTRAPRSMKGGVKSSFVLGPSCASTAAASQIVIRSTLAAFRPHRG
jgi:hypothetical protein